MSEHHEWLRAVEKNISQAILGKSDVIRLALVALLAEGHLLIEDAPGVGKTSLAKAIAHTLGCKFTRLQCTPDMLPGDILGTSVFLPNKGEFEFRPGPLFTNLLLTDEINRTTPRTQSALLEAMMERQISIDGQTYKLPRPFMVLATQNPLEFEGTYPLPENQLDRFMLCLEVGYPDREAEKNALINHRHGEPSDELHAILTPERLIELQTLTHHVRVDDAINDYILDIVAATRKHSELTLGVSTRGAITFSKAVQGLALVEGRDYVIPDDVKRMAIPVLAHRVIGRGVIREGQRDRTRAVVRQILDSVPVPK
ncbi:AAA family ATPase [Planctomyces sp. SH-PL14]|uniref:AAA family ATPase n=1 Tax=Planctomyces sp. SH-PL14 TaxID=1632864 RepID=UPI00078D9948|nr:MoxR family ATPase [Planctomyces sp. SH-PL14]AMV22038.1 ATPase family associated with various cellular activities (AAA) [Planctomyces sp. SH-PL14]